MATWITINLGNLKLGEERAVNLNSKLENDAKFFRLQNEATNEKFKSVIDY